MFVAFFLGDGAVDTAGEPAAEVGGVDGEDVECGFELGEDQDFVAEFEEAGKEGVEEEEFAGCGDEGVVDRGVVAIVFFFGCGGTPGPVEVVWAVAGEAGLHDGILELFGGDLFFGELERLSTFDVGGLRGGDIIVDETWCVWRVEGKVFFTGFYPAEFLVELAVGDVGVVGTCCFAAASGRACGGDRGWRRLSRGLQGSLLAWSGRCY